MRAIITSVVIFTAGCATNEKPQIKPLADFNIGPSKTCKVSRVKRKPFDRNDIGSEHPSAWKKAFDFSFIDVGIREALMDLSEQSQIPIVMGEDVTGVVSLNITNKNFRDSLQMIVDSGPYDYKFYPSGYYYVGLADPESTSWSKLAYTYQYRSKSLLPSKVIKIINPAFEEYVTANDKLRMISIFAPKNRLIQLVNMIRELDQSPRQISLKMTISEISSLGRESLGKNIFTESASDTLTGFSPWLDFQHPVVLRPNEYAQLMQSISFIQQSGEGEIRAQPALTVLEGEEAKVTSNTQHLIFSGTGYSSKPTYVNSEIGFSIVPRLADNNDIILSILKATASDIDKRSARDVTVTEQSIATTIRVSPGDSLLLGGMFREKNSITITKTPFLGSLPVVGWFFRNETENKKKMEVLFAIRPEVTCNGS